MNWERKKTQDLRNSIFYISPVVVVAAALVVWQGGKSSCNCNFKRKWKMEKICCYCLSFSSFLLFILQSSRLQISMQVLYEVQSRTKERHRERERDRARGHIVSYWILCQAAYFFWPYSSWQLHQFLLFAYGLMKSLVLFLLLLIEMATDLPGQSVSISNILLPFK